MLNWLRAKGEDKSKQGDQQLQEEVGSIWMFEAEAHLSLDWLVQRASIQAICWIEHMFLRAGSSLSPPAQVFIVTKLAQHVEDGMQKRSVKELTVPPLLSILSDGLVCTDYICHGPGWYEPDPTSARTFM